MNEEHKTYSNICDATVDASTPNVPANLRETSLACIAYPAGRFARSRYAASALNVVLFPGLKTDAECLNFAGIDNHGQEISSHPTQFINGIHFVIGRKGSAGAGHAQGQEIYRAFHGGSCYSLNINIDFRSGDDTVPPMPKTQETKILNNFRAIVHTFKFLK
jgi:hypothetical protein